MPSPNDLEGGMNLPRTAADLKPELEYGPDHREAGPRSRAERGRAAMRRPGCERGRLRLAAGARRMRRAACPALRMRRCGMHCAPVTHARRVRGRACPR